MKSYFKYIFAILHVITPARVYNYFILIIKYLVSIVFKSSGNINSPFAITIETVRGCNLKCSGCPAGLLKGKDIKLIEPDLFKSVIEEVYRKTFYLQLWFQGEPLLHNKLDELIMYAQKRKMFTVVATNGVLLTESACEMIVRSHLQKIILSIDVAGQSNNYYVGGNYARSLENMRLLEKIKKRNKTSFPLVEAQMVVTSENEYLIKSFRKDAYKAGADFVKLKSAWFYDLTEKNLPLSSNYTRYRKNPDGTVSLKHKPKNKCFRIISTLVLGYNGDIMPCCFDKKCQYVMGNTSTGSVIEIWKNSNFRKFRKSILNNRKDISICNNCLS